MSFSDCFVTRVIFFLRKRVDVIIAQCTPSRNPTLLILLRYQSCEKTLGIPNVHETRSVRVRVMCVGYQLSPANSFLDHLKYGFLRCFLL